jgi:hypothetical protein
MTTDATAPPVSLTTAPRPVTLEDIYRVIGGLYLELEVMRRENARLRELLERPPESA